MLDCFDPNTWAADEHECRIYADAQLNQYAIVDAVDYAWATQWLWHINKPHPTRTGTKQYLRRSQSNSRRYVPPLYLHVEIMKRTGILPPTEDHIFVDHWDGDEFNCRRNNLHWATGSYNRLNRFGSLCPSKVNQCTNKN